MIDLRPLIRKLIPLSIKRFISRFGHSCNIEIFLHDLKNMNIPIKSCIDVGAADGDFSKIFISMFKSKTIILIEPREEKINILRRDKIFNNARILFELISEYEEEKYFAIKGNASSYYDVNDNDRIIRLTSKRLDSLLSISDYQDSIIKIDVQGAELDVLKSISDVNFKIITAFVIEATTLVLWNSQPVLFDIMKYLKQRDFYLYSVGHMHRNSQNIVIQIDLCFINSNKS